MSALKNSRREKNIDIETTRAELQLLREEFDAITPINLEPNPLDIIPNIPNDIVPSSNLQGGYIPVFNFSRKLECQLVSLYSQGIDFKILPDIIMGPLSNGTISTIDIVVSSLSEDNVDINSSSNLMTTRKFNDKSFFGTFKIFNKNKPGLVLVGSYDEVLNSNSIFYEIIGLDKINKGTISDSNELDPEKEYDFELMTNSHIRRLYIKESSESNWSNSFLFEDILEIDTPHPVSSFGLLVNSNISIRKLRCDSAFYNKRQSFYNLVPFVENAITINTDTITAVFEADNFSEKIEIIQLPLNGLWTSAPNELLINLFFEQPGFRNVYRADIFTENIYENINNNSDKKLIGLLPNNSIPKIIIDSLGTIKNDTNDLDEKDYIENIIDGYLFEKLLYIEEVSSHDNTSLIIWLFNKSSFVLLKLLYTFRSNYSFDFDALSKFNEPSQVEQNSNLQDTLEKIIVYGPNSFKQLSIGNINFITSLANFY